MSNLSLLELLDDLWRNPTTRAQFIEDSDGFLAAKGFGGLDDPLVAEALGNVAAGLPLETAEHLSSFNVANSPLPPEYDSIDLDQSDPLTGLELLAGAPGPAVIDDDGDGPDLGDADAFGAGSDPATGLDTDDGLPDAELTRADGVDEGLGADGLGDDAVGDLDPASAIDETTGIDELDEIDDGPVGEEIPNPDLGTDGDIDGALDA